MNVEAMVARAAYKWMESQFGTHCDEASAFEEGYRRGLEAGVAEGVCMRRHDREAIRRGLLKGVTP